MTTSAALSPDDSPDDVLDCDYEFRALRRVSAAVSLCDGGTIVSQPAWQSVSRQRPCHCVCFAANGLRRDSRPNDLPSFSQDALWEFGVDRNWHRPTLR
jgi:hypothetical protein